MDGLTQFEHEHSTASELLGPRVNLTFRWITQHIKSCPLAGLIVHAFFESIYLMYTRECVAVIALPTMENTAT